MPQVRDRRSGGPYQGAPARIDPLPFPCAFTSPPATFIRNARPACFIRQPGGVWFVDSFLMDISSRIANKLSSCFGVGSWQSPADVLQPERLLQHSRPLGSSPNGDAKHAPPVY